jgi:hypothetical protein
MWTTEARQTTSASPAAVWQRWVSVDKWPEQDPGMEAARLEGPLAAGSKIIMKPKGNKESTVVITELEQERRFTTEGKIPLGFLRFEHEIVETSNGQTTFLHRVSIKGPLTPILRKVFADKMARDLPTMLQNIARLAESSR